MRRITLIAAAVLIPLVVLAAIALANYKPGLPAEAVTALNYYAQWRTGRDSLAIQQAVHARRPQHLTIDVNTISIGAGDYFARADVPEATAAITGALAATVTSNLRLPMGAGADRALPYPPADLWCVTLQPTGNTAPRVLLVAEHQDMYVSRWVVHELPKAASAPETVRLLQALGCAGN